MTEHDHPYLPRPSTEAETARTRIRNELRAERRSRALRTIALLLAYAALIVAFTIWIGGRPWNWAAIGYLAIGVVVAASWLAVSLSTAIEAGWKWRVAIITLAIAAPLIRSVPIASAVPSGLSPPDYKCAMVIAILGTIALVLGVAVLGEKRRRFGGAGQLFAATCAMVGAVAVGLRCLTADVPHNLSHIAAIAFVMLIVSLASGLRWRPSRL